MNLQNFKHYLLEGRDSLLYHTTNIHAAEKILTENHLKPGRSGKRNRNAISFTRNPRLATYFAGYTYPVIFEVDQRKLAQRYKFDPYNDYSQSHNKTRITNGYQEFEEALISKNGVINFKSYITNIFVIQETLDFIEKYHSDTFPELSKYDLKITKRYKLERH
jgi:hypothetical protein